MKTPWHVGSGFEERQLNFNNKVYGLPKKGKFNIEDQKILYFLD